MWGATAVDQFEQRVQVYPVIAGEECRQRIIEAGGHECALTPPRHAGPGTLRLIGVGAHDRFASGRFLFLPASVTRGTHLLRDSGSEASGHGSMGVGEPACGSTNSTTSAGR